jgi:hypothetical protein
MTLLKMRVLITLNSVDITYSDTTYNTTLDMGYITYNDISYKHIFKTYIKNIYLVSHFLNIRNRCWPVKIKFITDDIFVIYY